MASEPITVTDSDVQSLEKKLVEFAKTLPDAEQVYLAAMLSRGIENPDEVVGFVGSRKAGGTPQEYLVVGGTTPAPAPSPRTPLEHLQAWVKNWTG